MKNPRCKICGEEHALGICPEFQSTVRKNVTANKIVALGAGEVGRADFPACAKHHVDTLPKPKMGRPRTGYIKAEYNRQYMADLRTIKRLGLSVTVKQYRESLK